MPFNLLKTYNQLLEIKHLTEKQRTESLMAIFNRDIANNTGFKFNSKLIRPIAIEGREPLEILFTHITTTITDTNSRKREFDIYRSERLHWIKYHIEKGESDKVYIFSAEDKDGIRTYIYDEVEHYVIVLNPKVNTKNEHYYYFLTAYHLRGKDKFKIMKKYKRKLNELY